MVSCDDVTLIAPVETLNQRYRPGHQFHVRRWWDSPDGRVADLVDAAGRLRVSHCPADRFVSVSPDEYSVAEVVVSGSRSEEPVVELATTESTALPGTDDDCPFDANIELQLSREPRLVEHRPAQSLARRPFDWSDLPRPPPGYVAPLIIGRESSPPGVYRSADHPLREEWGPEWNLSEYCTRCPAYGRPELVDRMICYATRVDTSSESVLRFLVDLNNGEFWPWDGHWQRNAATVSKDAASASEIESEPRLVVPSPETAPPAVTSHTKHTVAPWLCEFGEYPEPSADWTLDQLRGWRTVRDRDGTICGKFGPDAPEQKHQWVMWLIRVQAFANLFPACAVSTRKV